jgi:hypothetical protein
MKPILTAENETLLQQLFLLAITTPTSKADVFVGYRAHAHRINVPIFKGGWTPCTNPTLSHYISLRDDQLTITENLTSIINAIKNL